MERDELEALLPIEVKGLTAYLVEADYTNAVDDAYRETGWTLPITNDFRLLWFKYRCKRHLFFYLASESAIKFHAKTFRLNQRFDHLMRMIDKMDADFEAIQQDRPEEFSDVDAYRLFGTKVDAGFSYDSLGNDTTYDINKLVPFKPDGVD